MERGDDIMPVAVNVPVVLDDVDELESPFPPQETRKTLITLDKPSKINFFTFMEFLLISIIRIQDVCQ
jgi:hypothetical protein